MQQLIALAIMAVGTALPGIIKQSHYPQWLNSLIATVIVVAAAILTTYSQNQLGPNFWLDTIIVIAAISALLHGPFQEVDQLLTNNGKTINQTTPQVTANYPVYSPATQAPPTPRAPFSRATLTPIPPQPQQRVLGSDQGRGSI